MKFKTFLFITIVTFTAFESVGEEKPSVSKFNIKKDLLLAQFDCKTDVDDLHAVAAFATLMANSKFSKIKYHAVAGTYGIQDGLYVPPNELFQLAFGTNWTDAHTAIDQAVARVARICIKTLTNQGDVWIAEAGQSDFTAQLVKVIQSEMPTINCLQRIHVVQHSDWNEQSTTPAYLQFVKDNTDYTKIPDGNAEGNGTPGFRSPEPIDLKTKFQNPKQLEIWQRAIALSNQYNGKEGRYNNEAISAGGFDFSDLSEVCWMLGIQNIKDIEQFFNDYAN